MKKLRFLVLFLVITLILFLTACSQGGKTPKAVKGNDVSANTNLDGPVFHLSMATTASEGTVVDLTMKHAKKMVEERSHGTITLDLFPAAQLGSDRDLVEGCQLGTVSIVIGATSPQVSVVPALAVFDLPNAIPDLKVGQAVLMDFQGVMEKEYAKANLKLLNLYPFLYRYMTSNIEVRKLEDFSGIRIRTMDNPYHRAYWESLGAKPIPLAFGELYIALQEKQVDAQENPLDVVLSSKIYKQQKYIINTKHVVFVTSIIMNKQVWDSMPSQYQALLIECFNESRDYAVAISPIKEIEFKKQLTEEGVQFIDLDDKLISQMVDRSQPVYEKIRKDIGADLVDNMLTSIDKVKNK